MPPKTPHSLEEAILKAAPQGTPAVSLRVLLELSGLEVASKSFSRVVDRLVKAGRLLREGGRTKAARYRLPDQLGALGQIPVSTPLLLHSYSREGAQIRNLLSRPLSARQQVSYDRGFLDGYVPNKTFYLPDSLRRHLRSLGQTPDQAQAAGTYAKEIYQHLLIDLAWNSSRLEGNTYSLLDTKRLLEEGVEASGKAAEDAQMILNHKEAIRFLVDDAGAIALDAMTVSNLHALLSYNLIHDPADRGRIRRGEVFIQSSVYIPLQVPQLLEELFHQVLRTARAIEDPFEQSFFILVHLPYLQPFRDVNKRTARLAANIPYIQRNLRPLSFTDVEREDYLSAHLAIYELGRVELLRDVFVFAYERSSRRYEAVRSSLGEPDPFRQRYRAQLKSIVGDAVRGSASVPEAIQAIERTVEQEVPTEDRLRFLGMAEAGLRGMHEGNFAEFGLRPSEYRAWQARIE